ncbi:argininosuccinate lyase [Candidatus Methylacidiphilum infernorum]|uniref:Argininosuccinate lyase n=1 Tax=Methylacidiphilum infernorum (isolate V4) TaxID=481448 RepID=B3E105_METI4|nr:argininosuccinate lyase [Candidatus Methylacidiphilum infernorum]ACD84482.1 Argininosuccinate lyase [Methylacidiphilum infernorum V4]
MNANKALWGGRFHEKPSSLFLQFSQSVSFDWRLYKQDIKGSIAHARMLEKIGIIDPKESEEIQRGLTEILEEIEEGQFKWSTQLEDIHMNIESALINKTKAGLKLHTGRSRNDQIATTMRLWVKEEVQKILSLLSRLQAVLVLWAEENIEVVIPGYTHLQKAQVVSLAHQILAYVEMLERDKEKFKECYNNTDVLVLGSGALAGSSIELDREYVANLLGFSRISQNSMDGVSDRDFVLDFLYGASTLGIHLSRFAEDMVLWSSSEWGFLELPDAFSSGSSLMPNKKNPDCFELLRGKSARLISNLNRLSILLKSLPLTYNRDMQEDKEPLFDSADTVESCLEMLIAMIPKLKIKKSLCLKQSEDPLLFATDIADWLVQKRIPFREAHHKVGELIGYCQKNSLSLAAVPSAVLDAIHPELSKQWKVFFDPHKSLERKKTMGSPNPDLVRKRILFWKESLKVASAPEEA